MTKIVKLTSFKQDPKNPNKGKREVDPIIEKSLKRLGAGRSIVVDKNNTVIAGNKTLSNAIKAGITDATVVKSKGTNLIVVQREDLDLSKDTKARELSILDNRAAELNLDWDPEVLMEAQRSGIDLEDLDFSISEEESGERDIQTEQLRPFKQIHILISCPVNLIGRVQRHIEQISEIDGVEIEQGSN